MLKNRKHSWSISRWSAPMWILMDRASFTLSAYPHVAFEETVNRKTIIIRNTLWFIYWGIVGKISPSVFKGPRWSLFLQWMFVLAEIKEEVHGGLLNRPGSVSGFLTHQDFSEDSACSTEVRTDRNPLRASASLGCCLRVTFTPSSPLPVDSLSSFATSCRSDAPVLFASPAYSSSPRTNVLPLPSGSCWVCVYRKTLHGSWCGGVKASVWMLTSCMAAWRLRGEQRGATGHRMISSTQAQSWSSSFEETGQNKIANSN